ncbi:hypothetical protein FRC00_007944, partial [Tulasnella sp. 408]
RRRTEKKSPGNEKVSQENTAKENAALDASPGFYAAMNAALDAISERMELLYYIGCQSGSFWQLVTSMSEILACCQGSPSSPTISTTQSGPTSSATDLNAHTDHPLDDDTDFDDGRDPTGDSYHLFDVAVRVRSWLGRLTQWYAALHDLSEGHAALAALNRRISITVQTAPRPTEPTKQAALKLTVEAVVGEDKVDRSLSLIVSRARQKWPDPDRPPSWPAGKTLVSASFGNGSSLSSWEDQFIPSSIHCEAYLAGEMAENMAAIGVSRRCCFCCSVLLRELGVEQKNIASHGKVYPHAPPPQASERVKEKILDALKESLEGALESSAASHQSDEPSSEARHDFAAPKDVHLKFNNIADILLQLGEIA